MRGIVQKVLMYVFWALLPYLIAAAVTSVHKRLSTAEDPWAVAVRIGQELTEEIKNTFKEDEE